MPTRQTAHDPEVTMGFYDEYVLPHCIDLACGLRALGPRREQVVRELRGDVLEIGFGSGLNLPFLTADVTRVLAVDPSGGARKIARKRIAQARCPVEFVGLEAEVIRLETASVDSALSTFTMCTIPEVEQALREVKRVLKPGARLCFLEHGRAPDAGVARWQDRLNGLQRFACGGCQLNRDIPELVRAAGFEIEQLDSEYMPQSPRTHGFLFAGWARA
ncbi:MAG: class I SAM-dependent methyltransferase [Myxococcales bacterium]